MLTSWGIVDRTKFSAGFVKLCDFSGPKLQTYGLSRQNWNHFLVMFLTWCISLVLICKIWGALNSFILIIFVNILFWVKQYTLLIELGSWSVKFNPTLMFRSVLLQQVSVDRWDYKYFLGLNKELTRVGFEPTTSGITCRRSTNWAM